MRIAVIQMVLLVASFADTALATQQSEPFKTTIVSVRFLEHDDRTERRALPVSEFRVVFAFIGGSISGRATTESLVKPQLGDDYRFTLDFSVIAAEAKLAASEVTTQMGTLAVKPRETKLARVGTFTMDALLQNRLGSTAFIDGETAEVLVLIYIDRACTIVGRTHGTEHEYRYDAVIPQPGFTWLRFRKIEEGVTAVSPTDRPSVLQLSVAPLQATD